MSSDFMWRKFDVSQVRAHLRRRAEEHRPQRHRRSSSRARISSTAARKDIPKIFRYKTHADNSSLYNTPPTFSIYLVRNVLSWLKDLGGLEAMEKINREKGASSTTPSTSSADFYRAPVEKASRSLMNVVFRLPTQALEEQFVAEAKKAKMVGLKGHRSVGGIRVSTYNAVSLESVRLLSSFMKDFAKANG